MTYKLYTLDNQFIKETEAWPDNFIGIVEHLSYGGKTLIWSAWYLNNKLHNLCGPAIKWAITNEKEYFVFGEKVTEKQHTLLIDTMKLKGLL